MKANVREPHRFDVVVSGGGPSGVAAAVASARLGAHTALIEVQGCLGGVWTAGSLSWVIDAIGKQGAMAEIISRLDELDARTGEPDADFTYDSEAMKLVLETMCLEAGVTIQLHTRVTGVVRDDRLREIHTESKSGHQVWAADVFIDATGDGDLAALAGCAYELGHPVRGKTQPMSLMALVGGVEYDEVSEFVTGGHVFTERASPDVDAPKRRLLEAISRSGVEPSYKGPTLFRVTDSLFALMVNHEYGYSALSAADVTAATLHARREINDVVSSLASAGAPWSGLRLLSTAAHIGIREGRRVLGRDYVSRADVDSGRQRPDAVCTVRFGSDIHAFTAAEGGYLSTEAGDLDLRRHPYDVPYGAMVPRDVEGLLTAGRCISGDFWAHSSYRVTGNAVTIGEAAGIAAATAVAAAVSPGDVAWADFVEARTRLWKISAPEQSARTRTGASTGGVLSGDFRSKQVCSILGPGIAISSQG
ncbi:glycine/D-amino acid oxidase-like deaminating enzyme [Microbacterium sp. W4I4]|nr:glycine/D-amino acid oxidase-like deaminating enzyme [Microbacterium sp. W4I4]